MLQAPLSVLYTNYCVLSHAPTLVGVLLYYTVLLLESRGIWCNRAAGGGEELRERKPLLFKGTLLRMSITSHFRSGMVRFR